MSITGYLPSLPFLSAFCLSHKIPEPGCAGKGIIPSATDANMELLKWDDSIYSIESWEKKFQSACSELDSDQLHDFISRMPQMIDAIDFKLMQAALPKINAGEHAFNSLIDPSKPPKEPPSNAVYIQPTEPWLFRFFATFIDTFITAFNFFDGSEPPTSIYEKHVLIQIYFRFFQIPFAVAIALQPMLLVAWKVYLVTAIVLGLAASGIYTYMKLRPFPKVIPHCEDLDEVIAKEFGGKEIRGLDYEMGNLLQALNKGPNSSNKKPYLFHAKTGNGKTTLICKFHQMLKNNTVPVPLRDKKVVLIQGGELMAKCSMGFGDKIKEIRAKLKGFENEAIVCVDEFQAIASKPDCFESMKKFMRTPGIQFVAITTTEGLNAIKKVDVDHSFLRPFNTSKFKEWEDCQVKSLLEEIAYYDAEDIDFEDGAIDKVLELTNQNLKDLSQPGKAVKFLDFVINTCRTNYELYIPENLNNKKMELEGLQFKWQRNYPSNTPAAKEAIQVLSAEVNSLEKEQKERLEKAKYVQSLIKIKNKLRNELLKNAYEMSKIYVDKSHVSEELQKKYLFYSCYLFPALKKLTDNKVQSLQETMDLRVDKQFVEKIFKEYKESESDMHES